MPPRFDDETRFLELSVADLLERQQLASIGFASRGGYERLWLGQAIHSRHQEDAEARDPSYRREIRLELEISHRGWRVKLLGRADGVRRDPDGTWVVEEIKSVRRGGMLPPAAQELYVRQALLYAWMLHRRDGVPVRAELVLIEIGSDEVDHRELRLRPAAVEGQVRRLLGALIRHHDEQRAGELERRSVAERLAFPHRRLRPGQDEIVAAVEEAVGNGDHLLLEAPAGIGKTAAVLYPAMRFALAHGKRLFVLTAKTLQQDMAVQVLKLLNEEQAFRSLRLRAKAKMCANDEVICHEEYCPYARDYYFKLRSSDLHRRLLADLATLEPDAIYAAATRAEICPFELSLDLAAGVQAAVCDYNYAFDPYVALSEFGPDASLADTVLVIDEIHNLVERGRGYYSPRLDAGEARGAAQVLARGGAAIQRQLSSLCLELADLVEERVEEILEHLGSGPQAAQAALPEEALWLLRPRLDRAFIDYLEFQRENKTFRADDPFVGLYFGFLRFLNAMLLLDETFATCAQRTAEGVEQLQILCKDPSRFLGRVINRTHSTVGLSATVSPLEFYRDLLGFDPQRTSSSTIANPFPEANRTVVIDPSVETTYRRRSANYARIAQRLGSLAATVPGNCLALFPSYEFLAAVADRLEAPGKRVLIQQRTDSDRAREALLEHLRGAVLGDVLLMAVAGGVFAEGVDYPGDMLKAVAVVSPCLPAVSLERQLLRDYYEERFERGFEYAYVVPGMTRVVQAAGRLLRSPSDRGVIALFDRRFLAQPYRRHLPRAWMPDSGPDALEGDPEAVARLFFAAAQEPS